MNEHTLKVLEFDKIREMLSKHCLSEMGRELATSILPTKDKEIAETEIRQTTELKEILLYEEKFPLSSMKDIRLSLKKAEIEGACLDPRELLNISQILNISGSLIKFFKNKKEKYPHICGLISELRSFDNILSTINSAVDPSAEIRDSASGRLSDIRHQKKTLRNRILDKLESMIGARKAKGPRQDDIITIRDGRYVIPMDESDFFQSRGIIHDRSRSGATVFVEPIVVVGMNNQLRELSFEEEAEIERILREISEMIKEELKDLDVTVRTLQELDFIHAKARLSFDYDGNPPLLNEQGYINLIEACHPLFHLPKDKKSEIPPFDRLPSGLSLPSTLSLRTKCRVEDRVVSKAEPPKAGEVVPLSLALGKDYSTLIITGPNAGGKTVALKTAGLLTLMALAGLHIPAKPYSEISVFKRVYADIGDEQSIEMSLSTFSSHMLHIRDAVKNADSESLILLDELGGGTDPKEGVALGEAVIDGLVKKEAKVIITTHHGALKILAQEYPQVRNASMEFDKETLTPTYRFQMGFPGSSYAIQIAQRLGMPEGIIQKAQEVLGSEERDLGALLESLEKDLKKVRENRQAMEEQKKVTEELMNLYQDRVKKLDEREKELKTKALRESKLMVEATRVELERLVAQIRKTQAQKEVVKQAHRVLEEKKISLSEELEKFEQKVTKKLGIIQPGDSVWIEPLGIKGEVISKDEQSKKLKVLVGNLTYDVEEQKLTRIEEEEKVEAESEYVGTLYSVPQVSPEIDLRGLLAEEAFDIVDKYLDNAFLAGLTTVSVIHGKGTGALRKKIGEFLSHHHRVEGIRLGEWNEGGSGVTIVKLKE
ncbi:MAG: endonuclease MutS2 [candidate division Zixibacteria bacterium]|nr:endonuclease MutS2 [candidate division Zixibacteria bacterium]